MLRIEKKTGLSPEDVIKRSLKFFGGFGMEVKRQDSTCAFLEGGGGGVEIMTSSSNGETSVEIVSREWDNFVKQFLEGLP